MGFDPELAVSLIPDLFDGLLVTLAMVPFILIFGGLLAIPVGLALAHDRKGSKPISAAFSVFFRGAPALVVLYMIYNGLPQVQIVRETVLWSFFRDPINCAVFGLILNHAAFLSEIWRGAFIGVPQTMRDACNSLGIPGHVALFKIYLPLAFRSAYSAYRNEVIFTIKATSIVGAVSVTDLLQAAKKAISDTYDPTTPLVMAAIFYWCVINLTRKGMDIFERRLRRHELR